MFWYFGIVVRKISSIWQTNKRSIYGLLLFILIVSISSIYPAQPVKGQVGTTLIAKDSSGIYQAKAGETELISQRTRNFKKFAQGDNQYRIAGQVGPIHYQLDPFSNTETYKEIDLTILSTPDNSWDYGCQTNGYQTRFWQSRTINDQHIDYIAQFRRANQWLAMAPIALIYTNDANQKQLIARPIPNISPIIDNQAYTITWEDVFGPGIDFRYNLKPDEFFKTLIINNKSDLPLPTINTSGLRLTLVMNLAWSSQAKAGNNFANEVTTADLTDSYSDIDTPDENLDNPASFNFKDQLNRNIWWLNQPKAWDSYQGDRGPHTVPIDWNLRRKDNQIYGLLSITANNLNHPQVIYPVYMDIDIPEEQVGQSTDDAYSSGNVWPGINVGFGTNTANLSPGANASFFFPIGARFQSVPLPPDATIDSASMSVCSDETTARQMDVTVWGRDEDSTSEWAAGNKPGAGPRTDASAQWNVGIAPWTAGTWYATSDCSQVVQEIIDRPGWLSDNNLSLVFLNTAQVLPPGNEYRYHRAYDYVGNLSGPKFNASYTIEGGDGSPSPQEEPESELPYTGR